MQEFKAQLNGRQCGIIIQALRYYQKQLISGKFDLPKDMAFWQLDNVLDSIFQQAFDYIDSKYREELNHDES